MLAKNHDIDTLNELSLIGASTCHTIFTTYVLNFKRSYFSDLVFISEGDEFKAVMDVYKYLVLMDVSGQWTALMCIGTDVLKHGRTFALEKRVILLLLYS